MKIIFQTLLLTTLLNSSSYDMSAQIAQEAYFELSDRFFITYVDESGNVDYEAIVKNSNTLDQLTFIITRCAN